MYNTDYRDGYEVRLINELELLLELVLALLPFSSLAGLLLVLLVLLLLLMLLLLLLMLVLLLLVLLLPMILLL